MVGGSSNRCSALDGLRASRCSPRPSGSGQLGWRSRSELHFGGGRVGHSGGKRSSGSASDWPLGQAFRPLRGGEGARRQRRAPVAGVGQVDVTPVRGVLRYATLRSLSESSNASPPRWAAGDAASEAGRCSIGMVLPRFGVKGVLMRDTRHGHSPTERGPREFAQVAVGRVFGLFRVASGPLFAAGRRAAMSEHHAIVRNGGASRPFSGREQRSGRRHARSAGSPCGSVGWPVFRGRDHSTVGGERLGQRRGFGPRVGLPRAASWSLRGWGCGERR